jgi:polyphosphate glucokinase
LDCRGTVLFLTLGTGIGSALFVDGKLTPNTELGHLYLRGSKIDVEEYASDRVRSDQKLSWKRWAGRLDEYFRHLELLLSPKLFILGGGVSKIHDRFIPYLTVRTKVVPAELRNEAGIIGAAIAAFEASTDRQ